MSTLSTSRLKIYDSVLDSYVDKGNEAMLSPQVASVRAPVCREQWYEHSAVVPVAAFVATFMVLVAISPPFVQNKQKDGVNSTTVLIVSVLAGIAVAAWPWIQPSS